MSEALTAAAPAEAAPDPPQEPGPGRRPDVTGLLRFLLHRPALVLSLLVVAAVLLAALWPGLFTGRDPLRGAPAEILRPPSARHWFGTDELGRDLFARVVHGAAPSLEATFVAVAVSCVAGGGLGLVAGFAGGRVDGALMRLVDVLLAVPGLFLSLTVVTALGRGTVHVAFAVGLAGVAGFARVMRAEVLRVRTTAYVEAARVSGARWYAVMARHVLPNAAGPVLALATLELGTAVLSVSSLSFLGFGAPPPAPEWGALIAGGRDYLAGAWWVSTLTGLTVASLVLAVNRIARAVDGERAAEG